MLWKWALRRVPWKTILVHGPTIVDAARKFYGTTRTPAAGPEPETRASSGPDRLRRAVEELEAREAQQAALFADLARQVDEIATAVAVLRVRVTLALAGSALATVVAIVALIVGWRR